MGKGIFIYFTCLLILAVGVTVFRFARKYFKRTAAARMQTDLRKLSARIFTLIEQGEFIKLDNYIRHYDRTTDISFLKTILVCTKNFKHQLPARAQLRDDYDNAMVRVRLNTVKEEFVNRYNRVTGVIE